MRTTTSKRSPLGGIASILLILLVVLSALVPSTDARRTVKGSNRSAASARKQPQTQQQDTQPTAAQEMLMSSRYITNSGDYLGITVDGADVKPLAVGYTLGIFGYPDSTAQGNAASEDAPAAFGHPKTHQKSSNGAAGADGKKARAAATSEFNAYSGFMSSPGEVLTTVSSADKGYASNGISISDDDYNLYNPHEVTAVNELDWTSASATVMVAINVKDIPQTLELSNGIVTLLSGLFSLSNETSISSAAVFAVPDEESGPLYAVQADAHGKDGNAKYTPDNKLSFKVDKEWHSGVVSAKKRADKAAQLVEGAAEQDAAEQADEVLVLSINVLIENPTARVARGEHTAKDTIIIIVPGNVTLPTIIPLPNITVSPYTFYCPFDLDRVCVSNNVPVYDIFYFYGSDDGFHHRRWYAIIIVAFIAFLLIGIGAGWVTTVGISYPFYAESFAFVDPVYDEIVPYGTDPFGWARLRTPVVGVSVGVGAYPPAPAPLAPGFGASVSTPIGGVAVEAAPFAAKKGTSYMIKDQSKTKKTQQ